MCGQWAGLRRHRIVARLQPDSREQERPLNSSHHSVRESGPFSSAGNWRSDLVAPRRLPWMGARWLRLLSPVTRISYSRTDTLLEHGLAAVRGWTNSVVGFPLSPRRVSPTLRRHCSILRPRVSDVHRRRLFPSVIWVFLLAALHTVPDATAQQPRHHRSPALLPHYSPLCDSNLSWLSRHRRLRRACLRA